jgi:hypothetical protein
MMPPATRPPSNRRPILLMLLLFVAPLGFAFWLYYGSSWRPSLRTNHGTLIQPVVVLPRAAVPLAGGNGGLAPETLLTGKWSLVVTGDDAAGCGTDCRAALIYARQTWLSLGKNLTRAQRLLLAGAGCCDADYLAHEHAGLIALDAAAGPGAALLRVFPEPRAGAIFVVDPLGNLMMRYDVRQDPKGLREDLAKLLELSHIG